MTRPSDPVDQVAGRGQDNHVSGVVREDDLESVIAQQDNFQRG